MLRILIISLLLSSCSRLTIDPSMSAVEAGDYTLVHSACGTVPANGVDACHSIEGTEITKSWVMIIPVTHYGVYGGDIDVYYRDIHKKYSIKKDTEIIEIKWSDFFGKKTWSKDMNGEVLALISLRYDKKGIEEVALFRGIAKIIVTKKGYTRLPIGSSFSGWETECIINYTTAGRSSLNCK